MQCIYILSLQKCSFNSYPPLRPLYVAQMMQKRNVLRYQSTSKTAYLLDWEWCNDSPSQGSDPGGKEGEQWEGQGKDREGQRHAWRGQHAEYEDALATLASQATSPSQCPP